MSADTTPISQDREFTGQDALAFTSESEEVAKFLEQGPLLEKLVIKIHNSDIPRLIREYPSLFPPEFQQNVYQFQIFAITFIRGKPSLPGHAKMKIYVEMVSRRILKIFATT